MKKQFVKVISFFTVFVLLCCPVLQAYLTDVDGSGAVGANDARLAERYAAGYDY